MLRPLAPWSRLRPSWAALLALPLVACSQEAPTISVDVTTGQEKDTFSMDPKVVRVDVGVTSLDGTVNFTAFAPPGGTFDLGDVTDDQRLTFEVTGVDAGGAAVVRGRSLSGLPIGAIGGETVPLFAQRTNRWSRPPGALPHTHVGGAATVLGERFLMLSGGAAIGTDDPAGDAAVAYYDLFALGGAGGDAMPRSAKSMVSLGDWVLLIDDGGATSVDFTSGAVTVLDPPTGLGSFADVAGGRAIADGDGTTYVIGGTRGEGAPTKAVLVVAPDGSLSSLALAEARLGAAATWAQGTGVVVAGGSATGAGVEILADGAPSFVARDYPPDPIEGAAATIAAPGGVALIGGTLAGAPAPTRLLEPSCSKECAATPIAGADLPEALRGVKAYAIDGSRVITIGDEAMTDGMTRSFLVDLSGEVSELPLREPRRGASVTPAPNGTLAILGGVHEDGTPATSVELLFPQ